MERNEFVAITGECSTADNPVRAAAFFPIRRPFPQVPRHIEATVRAGSLATGRVAVGAHGVFLTGTAMRLEQIAPRIEPPIDAACRLFPFQFRRQSFTGPVGVSQRIEVTDIVNRVLTCRWRASA